MSFLIATYATAMMIAAPMMTGASISGPALKIPVDGAVTVVAVPVF